MFKLIEQPVVFNYWRRATSIALVVIRAVIISFPDVLTRVFSLQVISGALPVSSVCRYDVAKALHIIQACSCFLTLTLPLLFRRILLVLVVWEAMSSAQ